jgi:hypothetical protein
MAIQSQDAKMPGIEHLNCSAGGGMVIYIAPVTRQACSAQNLLPTEGACSSTGPLAPVANNIVTTTQADSRAADSDSPRLGGWMRPLAGEAGVWFARAGSPGHWREDTT